MSLFAHTILRLSFLLARELFYLCKSTHLSFLLVGVFFYIIIHFKEVSVMKHAKINLILAGPASAERESLGKAISAKICNAPEEVFTARHNYEGAEDLAIILLAADADMEEWAKVNNTADLVLSPSASEEDKMEAIYGCRTSLLNSRHT